MSKMFLREYNYKVAVSWWNMKYQMEYKRWLEFMSRENNGKEIIDSKG